METWDNYCTTDIDVTDLYRQNDENAISDINFAYDLCVSEKREIQKHTRLYDLAVEDVVRRVRNSISYSWAMLFIKDAQSWVYMLKKGIDKRKKYPEKEAYNSLLHHLKTALGYDTIEITDIISYGYDCYGYRIEFITDSDYVYLLDIPVTSKYTKVVMSEFELGKCSFGYKVQRNTLKYIAHSYNICDFHNTIIEIQTNEDYKNHYSVTSLRKEEK